MNAMLAAAVLSAANLVAGAAVHASGAQRVDFDTQVVPILTKAGCNAAACHGSAAGEGGFRLSLFGGNPDADFEAIVRQREGRRIDWTDPDRSLLLAKPLQHLEHGGGQRLEEGSQAVAMLRRWIENGARRRQLRSLQQLKVEPQTTVAHQLPHQVKLKVTAVFDDGSTQVVNHLSVFESTDDESIRIDARGQLRVIRPGQHTVLVRFGPMIQPAQVIAPMEGSHVVSFSHDRHSATETLSQIDRRINAKLRQLRLPPSQPVDAATFLRRVTLDLTGRLPTSEQVQRLVGRGPTRQVSADQRAEWVDRLLVTEPFTDYWTHQLATLLRVHTPGNDDVAVQRFHQWLHSQVANDFNWKTVASRMLAARGDSHTEPAANFHRMVNNAREQAEYVAEVLMGVRIRCANCHRHPLDRWTQDDYHGLAQLFAKLERGKTVDVNDYGTVIHPLTGKPARPRIPGDRYLDDLDGEGTDQFANWLTAPDNPYFAKAFVGFVWGQLMGRGLVDPPNDLRATNPATHPELLTHLADEFVADDYDLRLLIRRIVLSNAYARSSVPNDINAGDDRFYSRRWPRKLSAEVLADAIVDATGVGCEFDPERPGRRAIQLADPAVAAKTLDMLGRCDRQEVCTPANRVGGVATQLALLNGRLLNDKLLAPEGHVQQAIESEMATDQIVDRFYLLTLSRYPTSQETEFWSQELDRDMRAERRAERIVDFMWSLLTCQAFTHNL